MAKSTKGSSRSSFRIVDSSVTMSEKKKVALQIPNNKRNIVAPGRQDVQNSV